MIGDFSQLGGNRVQI